MDFIFQFFLLSTINNELCKRHMLELFKELKNGKQWALQMLDATAKLPVGLLTANVFHYGNMDECMSVEANTKFGTFTGKHCIVQLPLPLPHDLYPSLKYLKYEEGICIPSSCSATDLGLLLQKVFPVTVEVNDLSCRTINDERPFQSKEIFAICIISFFVLLAILSTIYDNWSSKANKSKAILAFSLSRNLKTLMDMKPVPGSIDSLNGFRFFAISFVVYAHVYMLAPLGHNSINMTKYFTWMSDWDHIWLTSRGILLDSLFVLGGFLTTYVFMRDRDKGKKFNFFFYCIHRILRLGPAMYMVLLFTSTLINRLSSAPQWRLASEGIERGCAENWWQNVLFINSWFGSMKTCMGHTWYLSVDMTLYVLSPLLLIPLYQKPKTGLWLTIGTIVVAFLGSFVSSYVFEEHADLFEHKNGKEEFLYIIPYNRVTPWLIGILYGYYVHKRKNKKPTQDGGSNRNKNSVIQILKKWLIETIWFIVSMSLGIGIMLCVHPFLQKGHPFSAFEHSIYIATSHIVASLFTISCLSGLMAGYGGIGGFLLSSKIFIPLARLSYSVFLIHILIVEVWYQGAKANYYLSDSNQARAFLSILLYSVLFSPFLFLLVEQPFAVLDKLLLNPGNSQGPNSERKPIIPTVSRTRGLNFINNNGMELSERPNKEESPFSL